MIKRAAGTVMTAMVIGMVVLGALPSHAQDDRTITYYIVSPIPDVPDVRIPNDALARAIQGWQEHNPGLSFEPGDIDSDLKIEWEEFHYPEQTGSAYCDHPQNCIIEIGLGDVDCNGNYVQADAGYAANTIIELIGATFEMDSAGRDYLMPPLYDGYFVGEESVALRHTALEAHYDRLGMEHREIQDEILAKFEPAHQMAVDGNQSARHLIDMVIEKTGELQRIAEQMEPLSDELSCYHNVEPVEETIPRYIHQKDRTVTYRTGPVPDIPDAQILQSALVRAIHGWQQSNPGLVFERGDADADIVIEWEASYTPEYDGRTYCIDQQNCIMEIGLGRTDCNGEYMQSDANYVTNTITRGVGHALGLGHHKDQSYLISGSYEPDGIASDPRGWQMPESHEGYFVGEAQIREQHASLEEQHASLDLGLAETLDEYEGILEQTGLTNIMVQEAFQADSQSLPSAIYAVANKYTERTVEIERVAGQVDMLSDKLGCYHPEPEVSPDIQDMNRTVTYHVEPIPDISDTQIPQDALADAIQNWQELNPGLEFEQNDTSPDITIEWKEFRAMDYAGATSCDSGSCTIEIGLGDVNCHDGYVQADTGYVTDTIMQEVGHALGLSHHKDQDQLTSVDGEYAEIVFDSEDYYMPEPHKGHFVGEKQILEQINAQKEQYDRLSLEYGEIKKEIEEILEPYNLTFEVTQNTMGLAVESKLTYDVNPVIERLNEKASQINGVIDKWDLLIDEIRCYPDYERFYSSVPEVLRAISSDSNLSLSWQAPQHESLARILYYPQPDSPQPDSPPPDSPPPNPPPKN